MVSSVLSPPKYADNPDAKPSERNIYDIVMRGIFIPNLAPTLTLFYVLDAKKYNSAGYQKLSHDYIGVFIG